MVRTAFWAFKKSPKTPSQSPAIRSASWPRWESTFSVLKCYWLPCGQTPKILSTVGAAVDNGSVTGGNVDTTGSGADPVNGGWLRIRANTITIKPGAVVIADGAGYVGKNGADGDAPPTTSGGGGLGATPGLPGGGGGFWVPLAGSAPGRWGPTVRGRRSRRRWRGRCGWGADPRPPSIGIQEHG